MVRTPWEYGYTALWASELKGSSGLDGWMDTPYTDRAPVVIINLSRDCGNWEWWGSVVQTEANCVSFI